jgi:MFS-type transporter involved in bile tolerance (Atg22 family)
MSQSGTPPEDNRQVLNLTLLTVVGQVGCITPLIILAALFIGIWLDARFGSKPTFTIMFIVGSVPVALIAMFWIVKETINRTLPGSTQPKTSEEDKDRGTAS